jgi:hypothetical protein
MPRYRNYPGILEGLNRLVTSLINYLVVITRVISRVVAVLISLRAYRLVRNMSKYMTLV